jgi:hypothetical protein
MIYAGKKRGTFRFNLTIYRVKPLESGRYWTRTAFAAYTNLL